MSSSRLPERLISLRFDTLTTLMEPFSTFTLSTIQSEVNSQKLFHPRNLQKDVTLNSDLDRQIQKQCFRKGRFGISR